MKTQKEDLAVQKSNGVKAILLPEREEQPRFVNVPVSWRTDDLAGGFWKVDATRFFPDGSIVSRLRSDQGYSGDFDSLCLYTILFKDDFLFDGVSQENACVKRILQAMGKVSSTSNTRVSIHWRGTILVVKSDRKPAHPIDEVPCYNDISLLDAAEVAQDIVASNTVLSERMAST